MGPESHPHPHNQGPTKKSSGAKEGFSVYGLFHHLARTPQGKYLLRQWFLRPSVSITLINERLDAVAVLSRPENDVVVSNIIKNLASVVNIRMILINLRRGVSGGAGKAAGITKSIWSGIRKFSYHTIGISKELEHIVGAEQLPIVNKIREIFDTRRLAEVGSMINEVVDFEESLQQQRTVVRPNVDDALDERKRLYEGIGELLSRAARSIAEEVPEGLPNDLNVIYFPQIGFLVAMPKDLEVGRALWEGTEDEPWENMFSSEAITYYKNSPMRQMDEQFGDIYGDICGVPSSLISEWLWTNLSQIGKLKSYMT